MRLLPGKRVVIVNACFYVSRRAVRNLDQTYQISFSGTEGILGENIVKFRDDRYVEIRPCIGARVYYIREGNIRNLTLWEWVKRLIGRGK